MRRLLVIVALIVPALLLGGLLAVEQWPLWNAPHPGWLGAEANQPAPGACAAVAALRAFNAARADPIQAAITPLEARKLADRLTQHLYDLDAPPAHTLAPLLVRAAFPEGGQRLAWLVTAALPGDRASILYLDAETGGALAVITGSAAGEASRCTPDPRALLRRAARTPPALALAGYVGLVVVAGVLVIGYWWLRRKTLTVRGERRVLSG